MQQPHLRTHLPVHTAKPPLPRNHRLTHPILHLHTTHQQYQPSALPHDVCHLHPSSRCSRTISTITQIITGTYAASQTHSASGWCRNSDGPIAPIQARLLANATTLRLCALIFLIPSPLPAHRPQTPAQSSSRTAAQSGTPAAAMDHTSPSQSHSRSAGSPPASPPGPPATTHAQPATPSAD